MKVKFPTNLVEAREFQKSIAVKVSLKDTVRKIKRIGALDVAYKGDIGYAAGVIYDLEEKEIIEKQTFSERVTSPYIPTFLFLREVPLFLNLVKKFTNDPDIVFIDGHGIAHPQTAGSATVFGVLWDKSTIGIAKKPLRPFSYEKTKTKNMDRIFIKDRLVGIRYKVRKDWNPIYISPGNRVSVNTSFEIVKRNMTEKYKLPYPSQVAHAFSLEAKSIV
ncbi:MAG: endonuclease V [Candidatus Heimdallarchaeota archaeon]|nr:endonuclease V [Candidatus Heimdallarchaeota archaeon]MCK4955863.1 endonuclease V [Candidatus Heimdallarchaeota archaeon]